MDDGERTPLEEEVESILEAFLKPLSEALVKAIDEEIWVLITKDIPDLAEME